MNEELDAEGLHDQTVKFPVGFPKCIRQKARQYFRFCVNYKLLNEVSVPDAYPLPFVSSIVDKLRDALDIKSVYWQIFMAEQPTLLTGTKKIFIDQVVRVDLEEFCFVYLDDIFICSHTFKQFKKILQRFDTKPR